MNAANRTALVSAFVVVIVLFLLFSGGTMTGVTMGGGMMGSGMMGGISRMWIPIVLTLGLGILLGWVIFGGRRGDRAIGVRNSSRCLARPQSRWRESSALGSGSGTFDEPR